MLDRNDLKVCQSSDQLRDASFLIENMKDFMNTYDPPCVEMNAMVIVNKDLPQENDEFKIIIQYTEDVYQNIENSKGTSFETFFSGVGGFVGIFCGYSIMQIPETLDNVEVRTTFKKMVENLGKYY